MKVATVLILLTVVLVAGCSSESIIGSANFAEDINPQYLPAFTDTQLEPVIKGEWYETHIPVYCPINCDVKVISVKEQHANGVWSPRIVNGQPLLPAGLSIRDLTFYNPNGPIITGFADNQPQKYEITLEVSNGFGSDTEILQLQRAQQRPDLELTWEHIGPVHEFIVLKDGKEYARTNHNSFTETGTYTPSTQYAIQAKYFDALALSRPASLYAQQVGIRNLPHKIEFTPQEKIELLQDVLQHQELVLSQSPVKDSEGDVSPQQQVFTQGIQTAIKTGASKYNDVVNITAIKYDYYDGGSQYSYVTDNNMPVLLDSDIVANSIVFDGYVTEEYLVGTALEYTTAEHSDGVDSMDIAVIPVSTHPENFHALSGQEIATLYTNEVIPFFDEISSGKVSLQPYITPKIHLQPASICDRPQYLEIQQLLSQQGINITDFTYIQYIFTDHPDCQRNWAGVATIGTLTSGSHRYATSTVLSSLNTQPRENRLSTFSRVVSHELGHNLRWGHSSGYRCWGDLQCESTEYGPHGIMGSGFYNLHPNTIWKSDVNWIDPQPVINSQNVTIYRYQDGDAAMVYSSLLWNVVYSLEYRDSRGYDTVRPSLFDWQGGILINKGSNSLNSYNPINTSRAVSLQPGEVYTDSEAGISIGPIIEQDDEKVTVEINVLGHNPDCSNRVQFDMTPDTKSIHMVQPRTIRGYVRVKKLHDIICGYETPFEEDFAINLSVDGEIVEYETTLRPRKVSSMLRWSTYQTTYPKNITIDITAQSMLTGEIYTFTKDYELRNVFDTEITYFDVRPGENQKIAEVSITNTDSTTRFPTFRTFGMEYPSGQNVNTYITNRSVGMTERDVEIKPQETLVRSVFADISSDTPTVVLYTDFPLGEQKSKYLDVNHNVNKPSNLRLTQLT